MNKLITLTNGAFTVVVKTHEPVVMERSIYIVRHNYGQRKWSLPGGAMHSNETPEQTAERETNEETGLLLTGVAMKGIFISRKNPGTLSFLFKANPRNPNADPAILFPDEIDDIRLVTIGEALNKYNLYPGQRIMLAGFVVGCMNNRFVSDYLSQPNDEQIKEIMSKNFFVSSLA